MPFEMRPLERLPEIARRARRCVRAVFKICVETVVILAVAWQHGTAQIAVHNEVFVGSSLEEYLRLLQTNGDVSYYPWSIRAFSPIELTRLAPTNDRHPWAHRYRFVPDSGHGVHVNIVRPAFATYYNSTFPFGYNDGAVWAGRGFTTAFRAGISARWGPISLTIAPVAFRAENTAFELMENGSSDVLRFADGRGLGIDLPQRFGELPYQRLDPGQSTLRIDLAPVTLGASTANMHWGPATWFPILMGNNAAGFPHIFLGSRTPINLGFGRLHGRLVWGDLAQSEYTDITGTERRRFMTGIVAVFNPRGLEHLELGAARFFHQAWPENGLSFNSFLKPFESVLKSGLLATPENPTGTSPDNQLGSVFARWTFPRSGFEVYGEYGREDHNWDFRDLVLEPDHSGGFVVGLRKVWSKGPSALWSLRAEVMDLQVSQLIQARSEGLFYVHGRTRQGHTQRGQIIGSAFGFGGAASRVSVTKHHERGMWSINWTRILRQDRDTFWRTGVRTDPAFDVIHGLGLEGLLFFGDFDVGGGLTFQYNFNRDLGRDAVNVNASLSVRSHLGSRAKSVPRSDSPMPGRGPEPAGIAPQHGSAATGTHGEPPRNGAGNSSGYAQSGSLLPRVTGALVQRHRVDQLLGRASPAGMTLRSPSSLAPAEAPADRLRVTPLAPELDLTFNSDLPFSLNDGAMWAGRGVNSQLTGGFRISWRRLRLTVAPQLVRTENRAFEIPDERTTWGKPDLRLPWSSPWHLLPNSIDLPIRFGDERIFRLYPGQSTLELNAGPIAVGISTENQWWGPGVQNAIVLSNNAPGFRHGFLRTARPLSTPIGAIEARLLLGGLKESEYFDADSLNNLRSISAIALTWYPEFISGLALGAARAVYEPVRGWDQVPSHFLHVFAAVGRPNDRPPEDTTQGRGPDQILSVFARWVFPKSGFEVYGELSRNELPASFRDLLVAPNHTRGYTLGLGWARPVRNGNATLHLQAEHTYLAKSTTFRNRPVGTYYTSRVVPQGFTNGGQVLGAAIGPGSSNHWLSVDYISSSWTAGIFLHRIRWEDDALYTTRKVFRGVYGAEKWCTHDVSLLAGLRGSWAGPMGNIEASVQTGPRHNVFFQNFSVCGRFSDPADIVSARNTTLQIRYSLPFATTGHGAN